MRRASGSCKKPTFPNRDVDVIRPQDSCIGYPAAPFRVPVNAARQVYTTENIIFFNWQEASKSRGKYNENSVGALSADRLGQLQDSNAALQDENERLRAENAILRHQIEMRPEPCIPQSTLDALSVVCQHLSVNKKRKIV